MINYFAIITLLVSTSIYSSNISSPLKITPISRYSCVFKANGFFNGLLNNLSIAKKHYYFWNRFTPSPIAPNRPSIRCHDRHEIPHRYNDHSNYARYELDPANMTLWDLTDPRLYDTNSDGELDINTLITEEFIKRTNQVNDGSISINRFFNLNWQIRPDDSVAGGYPTAENSDLGVFMVPTIKRVGLEFIGSCPTRFDYQSNDILMNIIGEYVNVDTEAIYIAESEPYEAIVRRNNGRDEKIVLRDRLLVRERDLKSGHYYLDENGAHRHNNQTIGNHRILFNFPFEPSNPLVKKPYQRTYTVKHPSEIGLNIHIGVIPTDRRFGCIPDVLR